MAFGNEIKLGAITENWLVEIAGASTTLRLSFADCTISSNHYYGVILNSPTIRESIDLKDSKSKTSNINIDIPDFMYGGSLISELLFGGSDNFINRVVTVKSVISNATPEIIGYFRLNHISRSIDKISLEMASHRPWDFVDLPSVKTARNNYVPIAYGNYAKNSNTSYSSPIFETSLDGHLYYPCPYEQSRTGRQEFNVAIIDRSTDAELAYYDNGLDIFIPFTTPISNTFSRTANAFISTCEKYFRRGFAYRADGHTDYHSAWANETNAYNTNTGEFASYDRTISMAFDNNEGSTAQDSSLLKENTDIDFTFPKPDGKLNNAVIKIELQVYSLHGSNFASGDDFNLRIFVDWDGGTNYGDALFHRADNNNNGTNEAVTLSKTFTVDDDASFPDTIKMAFEWNAQDVANSGSEGSQWTQRVFIYIKDVNVTAEIINEEADIELAYVAADGLPATTWNSGNAITEIHQAHRDILYRFADVTTASGSIDGWSALETSKDWLIRYWKLNLTSLQSVLEKLQYEGGFIFRFKRGNTAVPQYIHIKDSYGDSDVDYTITKHDIKNININITPFSDLITKMNVNDRKHPTGKRYTRLRTATSSTVRTAYNIASKENTLDVNLDAYINPEITEYDNSTKVEDANANDNFFSYYYQVVGVPRLIVTGSIVNFAFYNIDVGDIVEFADMQPVKAFNKAFTDVAFMITSITRKVGVLDFEAQEIAAIS